MKNLFIICLIAWSCALLSRRSNTYADDDVDCGAVLRLLIVLDVLLTLDVRGICCGCGCGMNDDDVVDV